MSNNHHRHSSKDEQLLHQHTDPKDVALLSPVAPAPAAPVQSPPASDSTTTDNPKPPRFSSSTLRLNSKQLFLPSPLILRSQPTRDVTKRSSSIDKGGLFVDVFNQKDGKDKIIKMIQYTGRVILWIDAEKYLRKILIPQGTTTKDGKNSRAQLTRLAVLYLLAVKWARAIVPQFSMFRKIMRFGNWMEPIHHFLHVPWASRKLLAGALLSRHTLDAALELYNAAFDDIYLFCKFGLFKDRPALGPWADMHANYSWLAAIFLAMYSEYRNLWTQQSQFTKISEEQELYASSEDDDSPGEADEKMREKQEIVKYQLAVEKFKIVQKRKISVLNFVKLMCDFVFCTIEVLEMHHVNPIIPTGTGLVSGTIGYYKVYHKLHQARVYSK